MRKEGICAVFSIPFFVSATQARTCFKANSFLILFGYTDIIRVVTKVSSSCVNTTSRQVIKQLGSIFLLFSYESSWGPRSY